MPSGEWPLGISPASSANFSRQTQAQLPPNQNLNQRTLNPKDDLDLPSLTSQSNRVFTTSQSVRRAREGSYKGIREPLIFTDPGSILLNHPELESNLFEGAKQLALDLATPGFALDSPEYLDHWNQTVDSSNQLLRQRFGGQVWTAHHIQSHHLRAATAEGD
jgi:hypothetical protein